MKPIQRPKNRIIAQEATAFIQCTSDGRYRTGMYFELPLRPKNEPVTTEEFSHQYKGEWRILDGFDRRELDYVKRACQLGMTIEEAHKAYVPFINIKRPGLAARESFFSQLVERTDPVNMKLRYYCCKLWKEYRQIDEFMAKTVEEEEQKYVKQNKKHISSTMSALLQMPEPQKTNEPQEPQEEDEFDKFLREH